MNSINHINPTNSDIIASVPKDNLRSLFYLFAGKPDSKIKVFNKPIFLEPNDLIELNKHVTQKLETHSIDIILTSIKVGYCNSQFSEFSIWAGFENHTWELSEKIEELTIKWDFLVNIQNYNAPQRHTLLLRVSRDIKPSQILHMLGAGNSDELEKLDEMAAPAFCRVDFINAQISKELINLIEDWYNSRKQPSLINSRLFWLRKNRNAIATITDQWFLFSWSLLTTSLIFYGFTNFLDNPSIIHGIIATFFATYTLHPAKRISHKIGSRIFKILSDIEGNKVAFCFTSGDKKRLAELEQLNKKQERKFLFTSFWNIILNIIAALVYTHLLSKLLP